MFSVASNKNICTFPLCIGQFLKLNYFSKQLFTSTPLRKIDFGILFDVDGVLARGPSAIPAALHASELLADVNGGWRVPVLFFTNASNISLETKATQISRILHRKINSSEIFTPHSVLKCYSTLFDKHVAVCGNGPLKTIAQNIGFTKCSTIEDISEFFPWLDSCKPKQAPYSKTEFNSTEIPYLFQGTVEGRKFDKIEAIILLGEPERWECSLQILLDLLFQNGDLNKIPDRNIAEVMFPQLPIFACGSDFVWASSAPSPRIALGSFLSCLEVLYERLTGRQLIYTGLLGKPTPMAYIFALSQLNAIATKRFGAIGPLKRIYCIGDNPKVDIFGANLFNIFLQTIPEEAWTSIIERVNAMVQKEHLCLFSDSSTSLENPWGLSDFGINEPEWISLIQHPEADPEVLRRLIKRKLKRHPNCSMEPVLVMSGVYQEGVPGVWMDLQRVYRDFPDLAHLFEPRLVAADVAEAVAFILSREGVLYGKSEGTTGSAAAADWLARFQGEDL